MKKKIRLSTAKRKELFLEHFRELGNVKYAAKVAGIDRTLHYFWKKNDEEYCARFASAREDAGDVLESEAFRRSVTGVREPVFHRGEICGHVRKYSDVLLIFLLKGIRPEKFRERVELSDPKGRGPLTGALEDIWKEIYAERAKEAKAKELGGGLE